VRRGLDWLLEQGIVAERLLSDNAWAYTHNRSLKALLRARAIEHKTIRPHRPRPTARSSATSKRLRASGLTATPTPAEPPGAPHCHTRSSGRTLGAQ